MKSRGFTAELLEALPREAREAAKSVIERYAGATVYVPANRAGRRRAAAAAMLQNGMQRAAVQAALRVRFGISEDVARRDVCRVLRGRKSSRFCSDFACASEAESVQEHSPEAAQ